MLRTPLYMRCSEHFFTRLPAKLRIKRKKRQLQKSKNLLNRRYLGYFSHPRQNVCFGHFVCINGNGTYGQQARTGNSTNRACAKYTKGWESRIRVLVSLWYTGTYLRKCMMLFYCITSKFS